MKKGLLLLMVSMIIGTQAGFCETATTPVATSNTASVVSEIKQAIVTDVQNTLTSSVNNVKLNAYKNQLAQKKAELDEVENSNTFALIKVIRKILINNKISELEANIAALEKAAG